MEKLIYRKFKGLEVRCLKCNKSIHKDNSPVNGCKHPIEKTVYRAIVWTPNTKSNRTTVTLKARTYDAAVKELIDYRCLFQLRSSPPFNRKVYHLVIIE